MLESILRYSSCCLLKQCFEIQRFVANQGLGLKIHAFRVSVVFFYSFSQIWHSVCIFSRYFCCSQRSHSVVVTFWLFVDLFVWQRFDCAYLGFVSLIVYLFYTIFKFCLFFLLAVQQSIAASFAPIPIHAESFHFQ